MAVSLDTGPRRRWRLPFSPWHLLLMPLALIFVLPLVQMVLTSFMTTAEINQFPPKLIPTSLHLEGYRVLLTESHIVRWFANTVLVSTIAVVSHLVLCSLAGYGFAQVWAAPLVIVAVFALRSAWGWEKHILLEVFEGPGIRASKPRYAQNVCDRTYRALLYVASHILKAEISVSRPLQSIYAQAMQ